MLRIWFVEMLAQAAQAPQQGGGEGGRAPNPAGGFASLLVPMAAVFFIFWLLIFRPESKKRKERERMIANVKKGDFVVTTGGLIGKVWRVDGSKLVLIIDKDREVKARFTRNAILEVLDQDAASGGNGDDKKEG